MHIIQNLIESTLYNTLYIYIYIKLSSNLYMFIVSVNIKQSEIVENC